MKKIVEFARMIRVKILLLKIMYSTCTKFFNYSPIEAISTIIHFYL